jgi:hypothetical protein
MEKNKKSKNPALFILLFILIIVFLINTSAVFSTASLGSAVNKIFGNITTFISNSLLFSDVRPPLKKVTEPSYGTKCELVVTEGLTKQWSFKICVATNTSTKRLCNQNSDCDPFFRPIQQPLLSGTRCKVDDGWRGMGEMRCIVDPLIKKNYCYSPEDCNKTFKECDSFTKKCLETAGLGINACKTDDDCK